MRASFLYIVVLLCKIIKFICRFFGFLHRAPSAARSDCVRCPSACLDVLWGKY
mgnify:CR=1 FL=1